ncbi:hypothetical protein PRIPAC_96480 [Pristionchus pacificus]|uniref:Uncharacterized protein n=1 Tax=Pristionchus pacificus TaxID=54126 RepID=A0A2A6B2Z1_PRIPA|nr:hypothetical protein PRIPAC_96480 [Pristionchus pacificus]|eukprot:PDM60245.1 hypothetical protein PRIPAC_54070 [Pristionchus pacificus]
MPSFAWAKNHSINFLVIGKQLGDIGEYRKVRLQLLYCCCSTGHAFVFLAKSTWFMHMLGHYTGWKAQKVSSVTHKSTVTAGQTSIKRLDSLGAIPIKIELFSRFKSAACIAAYPIGTLAAWYFMALATVPSPEYPGLAILQEKFREN